MPTEISSTIQEHDGIRYYRCGRYFQCNGSRLHRIVWQQHNGEIPAGFDVHHIDGDRSNNGIENLQLMHESDHARHHNSQPERIEHSRMAIKKAQVAATEWHKSADGHEWHKEQYARVKDALHQKVIRKCEYCGNEYMGPRFGQFCSNNCRCYSRRDSGIDNIMRECAECGESFEINKYAKGKYCGRSCAGKASGRIRRARRDGGCLLPKSA